MSEDFYANKPSWFPDYAVTVASYVARRSRVLVEGSSFITRESNIALHVADCPIVSVSALDEEVNLESTFDSFGDNPSALCLIAASVTCSCGEYKDFSISIESTISEAISSIFYVY